MIRAQAAQSPATKAVSLVQAWLASNGERPRRQIAALAGIDEKTLRLALKPSWNPTVETVEKIYRLIPIDWQPPKKRRAA